MKPYIIAEIACAHLGDPFLCVDLIGHAHDAGAQGVKVQVWQENDIKKHISYKNMKRFEISQKNWEIIAQFAHNLGIDLWIEAISRESIEFAMTLNPFAWKIPYFKFIENVKIVDGVGQPVFWRVLTDSPVYGNNVAIGEQGFPTSLADAKKELELVKHFKGTGRKVIYSDHQDAYEWEKTTFPALAAYHDGADYIEKHICLNREALAKESKDHCSALEPHEFKQFVKYLNDNEKGGKVRAIL